MGILFLKHGEALGIGLTIDVDTSTGNPDVDAKSVFRASVLIMRASDMLAWVNLVARFPSWVKYEKCWASAVRGLGHFWGLRNSRVPHDVSKSHNELVKQGRQDRPGRLLGVWSPLGRLLFCQIGRCYELRFRELVR